jgi:hypothetical protein
MPQGEIHEPDNSNWLPSYPVATGKSRERMGIGKHRGDSFRVRVSESEICLWHPKPVASKPYWTKVQ